MRLLQRWFVACGCSLCRLGDAGACALAALIADGAKLSSLQLCSNDISDDGMVALAQVGEKTECGGPSGCFLAAV